MEKVENMKVVRELARSIMDYADRKDYGLGECRYELNKEALDKIEECDAYIGFNSYDTLPLLDEDKCSAGEEAHQTHIKDARSLANAAYQFACDLEGKGIRSFS